MSLFVKAGAELSVWERVFARNLVSFVIAMAVILRSGKPSFGLRGNRRFLLLRGVLGVVGVTCFFFSIDNLLLADAVLLNKLSPFFVFLFASLFLSEKISRLHYGVLLLVFASAMLIIKPGFDYHLLPGLIGLLGAAAAGGAYTVVRFLAKREAPETIIFIFSLVTLLVTLPLMIPTFRIPTLREGLILLATGVFASGGQFGLTFAYRFEKASTLSVFTYLHVLFAAILGYLFWKEVPDLLTLIGGTAIIFSSILLAYFTRNETHEKQI